MHRRSSNNIICFKSIGKFYCYYLVSKQQDDKEVRNNFCLGSHFWKKVKRSSFIRILNKQFETKLYFLRK